MYLEGVKNAEAIADKMKRAIRRKDRLSLERIINEAIAAGLPELDAEIENAQQILSSLDNTTTGWNILRVFLQSICLEKKHKKYCIPNTKGNIYSKNNLQCSRCYK